MDTNVENAIGTLHALGSAWRGDWSDFDGRTLRDQLEEAAGIIRRAVNGEDVKRDVAAFYVSNDICQRCGSWTEHCNCA